MTPFLVALGASALLTGLAIPLLRRGSFLDLPNNRSSHEVPTPRGGGAAVMVAVVAGAVVHGEFDSWPVVLPALLLAIVGFADDLWSLSARLRLAAQVMLGGLLCLWVASAQGDVGLPLAVFIAVCLVGLVGYVNAFNFMDGIDGISALNAAVAGAWFAWLGHSYSLPVLALVGSVAAGGALGFLPWNAKSLVFLGDVGSYGIGTLLGGAAILAWAAGVPGPLAIAPLLVYLADTAWVVLRRARAGHPLLEAHREHAYQRLVRRGWSHLAAAAWSAGISGAGVLVMAWLYPDNKVLALTIIGALILGYLVSPRVVEDRHGRRAVTS